MLYCIVLYSIVFYSTIEISSIPDLAASLTDSLISFNGFGYLNPASIRTVCKTHNVNTQCKHTM